MKKRNILTIAIAACLSTAVIAETQSSVKVESRSQSSLNASSDADGASGAARFDQAAGVSAGQVDVQSSRSLEASGSSEQTREQAAAAVNRAQAGVQRTRETANDGVARARNAVMSGMGDRVGGGRLGVDGRAQGGARIQIGHSGPAGAAGGGLGGAGGMSLGAPLGLGR